MSESEPTPGTIELSGTGSYEVTTSAALMATDTLESGDEIDGESVSGEVSGESDTVEYFGTLESVEYSDGVEIDATSVNDGEPLTLQDAIQIYYDHGQDWNYVPGFEGWETLSEYHEDNIMDALKSVHSADVGDMQWITQKPWFDKSNVTPENRTSMSLIDWPETETETETESEESGADGNSTSESDVDLGEFAPEGEDYTGGGSGGDSGFAIPVPSNPIEQIQSLISDRDWLQLIVIFVGVFAGFFIGANLLGRELGIALGKVLRNA